MYGIILDRGKRNYRATTCESDSSFTDVIFPGFDEAVTSVEKGDDPIKEVQYWPGLNMCI